MLRLALGLILVPALLIACNSNDNKVDVPAHTGPAPVAQCGLTSPNSSADASACFTQQAARSDLFEIQSSQLALSRSSNQAVKDFAQQIITDHQDSSAKLKARADALKIPVPTDLDANKAADMQFLQSKNGADFNRAYATIQVNAHMEAIDLFNGYKNNGGEPSLKDHANETLPHLQHHLDMARTLLNSVK